MEKKDDAYRRIRKALETTNRQRRKSQVLGALGFIPFIGLLLWHAVDHEVPLFLSSFSGFAASWPAIASIPKMRRFALREAAHEYKEYLFLIPLFFSITVLEKTGFLDQLSHTLNVAIERLGSSHVAFVQFAGTVFLSAILDNNVVADFGGPRPAVARSKFDPSIRARPNRGVCRGRVLDAHRLGSVRGRLCIYKKRHR